MKISTPSLPFLSATSAAFEKGDRLRALLAQQLTAPVRFTQTVRMALDHGVDRFVEFGHRRVLVGLVRRIRARASRRSTWATRPTSRPSWRWPGSRRGRGAGRARHRGEQGDRGGMCGGPRARGYRRRPDLRRRPRRARRRWPPRCTRVGRAGPRPAAPRPRDPDGAAGGGRRGGGRPRPARRPRRQRRASPATAPPCA